MPGAEQLVFAERVLRRTASRLVPGASSSSALLLVDRVQLAGQPPTVCATLLTDALLTAGVTPLEAVHLTEVRTRANAVRTGCGLAAATWTDPVLAAGVTPMKAAHMLELRDAVIVLE